MPLPNRPDLEALQISARRDDWHLLMQGSDIRVIIAYALTMEKELKTREEALAPFATYARLSQFDDGEKDTDPMHTKDGFRVTVGDYRRAIAALEKQDG